jgi:glycosyltransferase involved in cell wall biosynthesis
MAVKKDALCIVSHVIHLRHREQIHAYGPYAHEIEIWADLFDEVIIAAPVRKEEPTGFAVPIDRGNVSLSPQIETGGNTISAKLLQLISLPIHIFRLCRAMKGVDAIHVRCPGTLGLLGVILAPLFSKKLIAKYAGQWPDYDGEPWSYRLQKKILRSRWWNSPVTVYGEWPNEPQHVVPFFTSMMTREQVADAVAESKEKKLESPLRVVFSGRLSKEKGVHHLIDAVGILKERGLGFEVSIIGNGAEFDRLQKQIAALGIGDQVRMVGDLPYEAGLEYFKWGHVLVLPSQSEGFPKVLVEAMCHGMVCIGTDSGLVPKMLEGRGIVLDSVSAKPIADAIETISSDADRFQKMSRAGVAWASQYSIEGLRDALQELMEKSWGVSLDRGGR